jgi:hypothetical protein
VNQVQKSGRTQKAIGVILLVLVGVIQMVFQAADLEITGTMIPFLMLSMFLLTVGGVVLLWRGKQHAARKAAPGILGDARPEVLYLRPFRSDTTTFKNILEAYGKGFPGMSTDEEQLAEALLPFGKMVAIGRPGEPLPTPGAVRIYADKEVLPAIITEEEEKVEEWKKIVDAMMRAARLVVIQAGTGDNLFWELNHAVRTVEPRKLLIMFRGMSKKEYEIFRAKFEPVLGVQLSPAAELWRFFWGISGFMSFAGNWRQPRFHSMGCPLSRRGVKKQLRFYHFTLKPVFEDFGLEWNPPPVSALAVAVLIALPLLLLLLLVEIIALQM